MALARIRSTFSTPSFSTTPSRALILFSIAFGASFLPVEFTPSESSASYLISFCSSVSPFTLAGGSCGAAAASCCASTAAKGSASGVTAGAGAGGFIAAAICSGVATPKGKLAGGLAACSAWAFTASACGTIAAALCAAWSTACCACISFCAASAARALRVSRAPIPAPGIKPRAAPIVAAPATPFIGSIRGS